MAANLDWPLVFKRQYAGALDADHVMQDLTTLQNYIDNSGLAFEGQVVYIKDESALYQIDDDGTGTLIYNAVDSGGSSVSANQVSYSFNDTNDWDTDPTQVNTALDELADRLTTHEDATGNVHNTTLEQVRAQANDINGLVDFNNNGIDRIIFLNADESPSNQTLSILNAATTSGGFEFKTKNAADSASITALKIDNGDDSLVSFANGVGINGILDEDDMISDDDTKGATQQSIKAYVDSNSVASAAGSANQVQYNDGSNGFAANAQGKYHPTEEAWTYGYRAGTIGDHSFAEGGGDLGGEPVEASGSNSHAEGSGTVASGAQSHAEGLRPEASGNRSHAEGRDTVANNAQSHAEGNATTASGSSSHAEGNATTASGNDSHAEGVGSEATANQTHAGGSQSKAYLIGQFSRANSRFAANGDAQYSNLVGRISTSDATTAELLLGGSERLAIPDNTTWLYKIRLVARRTDADGENAGWLFEGIIKKDGTVGSTAITTDSDTKTALVTTTWDANVSADTTNGALQIDVTGEAAKTINWVAKIELVEVAG